MAATGIAFRATSGYVTDAVDDTYDLGEEYPTTRSGLTFGWASGPAQARDRSTGIDARLAGINFQINNGTQNTFRVDITPGTYAIRLALGDEGNGQDYQYLQFKDDISVLGTIDDSDGTATDHFDDATGADYTAAAWPASNSSINLSFTSTVLNIVIGAPSGAGIFATTLAYVQFISAVSPTAIRDVILQMGIIPFAR